jgi:dihydropteroate synthase
MPEAGAARTRPTVFGILNVTPDSFSDGGRWNTLDDAIEHGVSLAAAGADIVDVGGESTRPGAERVGEAEEQERVIPVIAALVQRGVRVSVDTMRASTASLSVQAGAAIVNDVSGGLADPEMYGVIAGSDVDYVAMHWRDLEHSPEARPPFNDVVQDVRDELKQRLAELVVWGVDPVRIIVDPGIGFGKLPEENWQLLGHLDTLATLGHRVLVGVSRKRILAPFAPDGAPPSERDQATAIISALAAQAGVWAVRVHDVARTRDALRVWEAVERGATE